MDAFDATPLCPAPVELALDHVAFHMPRLVITAHARRRVVPCPLCGQGAARVHSRYRRTIADLPWQGLRVRLVLETRRFFCDTTDCARRIFTERFPTTIAPYGRRRRRAAPVLGAMGFAVGGCPGARLAAALGLDATATTIITALRAADERACRDPRVLGVDDCVNRRPKFPTKRHLKFPTGVITPPVGLSPQRGGVARRGASLSADTNRL